MRRRLIVGIGLLYLTAGCLAGGMGRGASDLPVTRPLPSQTLGDDRFAGQGPATGHTAPVPSPAGDVLIPVLHPPDEKIIAREPPGRQARQLHAELMKAGPILALMNWSLFAVVIAF